MSATGTNIMDLLPLPETNPATAAAATDDHATASHAFAQGDAGDHSLQGAVQAPLPDADAHANPDVDVKDLGWNEAPARVEAPLVGGMHNEELWILVRRFNKQMYHVKEVTAPVPGNLDLNIADDDEFSPDKLRSTLERLYMTVLVGLLGLYKHITRLRSWREKRRTAAFLAAYTAAWALDCIVPLLTGTLVVLIAYPPARHALFPPAPLALVGKDGAPQKPRAGVLGSHDSATGAPENYKGEAVEAEAQNFVNGIAQVALSSAAGKHPLNDDDDDEGGALADAAPDPTALATGAARARAHGGSTKPAAPAADKTKAPMETAMWNAMRPAMHALQDVVDTWERFANALSPTPPFPKSTFRLRLAAVVVPLFAASLAISSYAFTKAVWAGLGFGFFGQPALDRGLAWLNAHYPHWQRLLELRNTLLKGVPTNAQLTLTLLRLGEAHQAPLPPPPIATDAPANAPLAVPDAPLAPDAPLGATPEELAAASAHDPAATDSGPAAADEAAAAAPAHGKTGSKIVGFFKGGLRTTVNSALGVDHARAKTGSLAAKNRVGAVPKPTPDLYVAGPVAFRARYRGHRGHVYLVTRATVPCVAFAVEGKEGKDGEGELKPLWSIAVADVVELKKVGGFGWKAKLLVGWALERSVADGVEIVERGGAVTKITAMPTRDELFNRLVAMGGQKWEAW